MVKAVIFDAGGVVLYAHPCDEGIAKALKRPLSQVKKAMAEPLELFRTGKIKENFFWQMLSENIGLPMPENKEKLWRENFEKNFHLFDEAVQFIKEVKKQGIKTAVLSNTIQPHVEINRRKNVFNLFDVVVLSCEVGMSKPHLDIYQYTLKKLGVRAEECIYFDDLKENLKPAQKLGIKTVLVKNLKKHLPI